MRKTAFTMATLTLAVAAGLTLTAASRVGAPQALVPTTTTLLDGGGFERWLPQDLAPLGWLPNGAASLDVQTNIQFGNVSDHPGCLQGGGRAMELTSATDSDYVYQRIAQGAGLAGNWVTASLQLRSGVGGLQPVIEIDDGVGAPTQHSPVVGGAWEPIRFEHRVDDCAAFLELRIYPRGGPLIVDDAILAIGKGIRPIFSPRNQSHAVPIGGVIDWYPAIPGTTTLPAGYAIADGSVVSDVHSPMRGLALPDLVDRFVKGATLGSVLQQGGVAQLNLSHDHGGRTGDCQSNGFDFWIQFGGWGRPALEFHDHTISGDLGSYDNAPPYTRLIKLVRTR